MGLFSIAKNSLRQASSIQTLHEVFSSISGTHSLTMKTNKLAGLIITDGWKGFKNSINKGENPPHEVVLVIISLVTAINAGYLEDKDNKAAKKALDIMLVEIGNKQYKYLQEFTDLDNRLLYDIEGDLKKLLRNNHDLHNQ